MTCKNGIDGPGDRNIDEFLLAFCVIWRNVDCGEHGEGGVRIIYIEGQCSINERCRRQRARFTFTDDRYTRFAPLMFHLNRNNDLLYLKEVLAARQASLDRDSKGLREFCMGKVR